MLKLRRLQSSDIDAVHALVSIMDVVQYMLLPYAHEKKVRNFFETRFSSLPQIRGDRSS